MDCASELKSREKTRHSSFTDRDLVGLIESIRSKSRQTAKISFKKLRWLDVQRCK